MFGRGGLQAGELEQNFYSANYYARKAVAAITDFRRRQASPQAARSPHAANDDDDDDALPDKRLFLYLPYQVLTINSTIVKTPSSNKNRFRFRFRFLERAPTPSFSPPNKQKRRED